ncbi:MAG: polymerase alpha subunit [Fibrobacteres bacterium]|nr:polymerase alpha subunit [Fibrobacterota bacterium]
MESQSQIPFVHLHAHSEYSMLQSSARISGLVKKALELKQTAIALTDHGNMFGMLEFHMYAKKAGIKALIGCDFYVAPDRRQNQNYSPNQPLHHKLILIAATDAGYKNLMHICSDGYMDGFFQKPRIDHESLRGRSEGLICLTSNHQGEVGYYLLKGNEKKAREILDAYAAFFGKENVYLCLQSHGLQDEETINKRFLELHKAEGWKLVAVNDVHYLERPDAEAHEVMLCIEGGHKFKDANRPRFNSDQYYLRSGAEMAALFKDYPDALENTVRIAEQCNVTIEFGKLHHPQFPIPPEFTDSDAYLAHLSREGMAKRYPDVTDPDQFKVLQDRMEFELEVMKRMKVAGYMLIVQDFCNAARQRNIPVGPGRGSAVGSIVSYAVGITDVDPIRYNLLFERFLNPERVSMPDIDTDFSDNGRQEVIQYVVDKYGTDSVAQIVTYGRMKAKMVLRDVGRVMGFEAQRLNQICKLFPAFNPFADLQTALNESADLKKEMESEPGLESLKLIALKLEGLVRQAGMHAAAVIIAPKAIVNFAPLFKQPGSDQVMIQYDKTYSEDIGLLKMDFLGLRNLSVIQDCLAQVEASTGEKIDPLKLPETDKQTFQMLGKGLTVGVFQFESGGMQDYLRKLKPSVIEDLIAMNALYRPGPMEFIPDYIARKNGNEKPDYYHESLKPILQETYGVIVYQEQVMQLAQVLAGFSLGGADLLRRAMAKKDLKKMDDLKPKFVGGAKDRGYDPKLAERIWEVLVPFSSYAFNKSHSAAYATVAYQTAYLKAHYPAQFMAANMNSEMHDTTRLVVLLNDCKYLGIEVTFPNINVSLAKYTEKNGKIVYGLGGIKNVGLAAVEFIVKERDKNGPFVSIFDLCKRVDSQYLNRRALESLVLGGALPDDIPGNRAQQFAAVETALAYAQSFQQDRDVGQVSLFDGGSSAGGPSSLETGEPPLPNVDPWPYNEMLEKEKEVLGLYLSGHPLEPYRIELRGFTTCSLDPERLRIAVGEVKQEKPKEGERYRGPQGAPVVLGGMITRLKTKLSAKDNKTFAFAELEDFVGKVEIVLWSDVFEEVRHLVELDSMVLIRGNLTFNEELAMFKLNAQKVLSLPEAREKLTRSVHVRLKTKGLQEPNVTLLHDVCSEYVGNCQLVLHLEHQGGDDLAMVSEKLRVTPEKTCTASLAGLVGADNVWLSAKTF